jgi:hypothetical protein
MNTKWLIFFCSYLGSFPEPDGKIEIGYDSIRAFGVEWSIQKVPGTFLTARYGNGGDLVDRAEIVMKYDTTTAYLSVRGRHVYFRIPGVEYAKMQQLPHHDRLYEDDN